MRYRQRLRLLLLWMRNPVTGTAGWRTARAACRLARLGWLVEPPPPLIHFDLTDILKLTPSEVPFLSRVYGEASLSCSTEKQPGNITGVTAV